jgi:hypothetical protein
MPEMRLCGYSADSVWAADQGFDGGIAARRNCGGRVRDTRRRKRPRAGLREMRSSLAMRQRVDRSMKQTVCVVLGKLDLRRVDVWNRAAEYLLRSRGIVLWRP